MAAGDLTVRVDLDEVLALLNVIWERVCNMPTQADVDAMAARMADAADQLTSTGQAIAANVAELTAADSDLAGDIQSLKDQLTAAGLSLDLTGLDANLARVTDAAGKISTSAGQLTTAVDSAQALAAETPPPAP